MRNNLRKSAGLLAVGAVAAGSGALGACSVESSPYLVIKGIRGIELSDGACAASEDIDPSTQYDAGAAADSTIKALGLGKYLLGFQVTNALAENDDEATDGKTAGRLDTNRIQLSELRIKIDNEDPWGFLPADNTATLTQMVGPGEDVGFIGTVFDETLASAMLLGAEGQQSPIDQVGESFPLRIALTIVGTTLDGTEVESNTVEMSVTICNRCLDRAPLTPCFESCSLDQCDNGQLISVAAGCSLSQFDGFGCGSAE